MSRFPASWRSLRVRLLVTAVAVFAISLAVASFFAHELLLQDGLRDADAVLERQRERFEQAIAELVVEAQLDAPDATPLESLRTATHRYLQLNPSTDSYWVIVTFEDGQRLAAANGPPALEPLFHGADGRQLPVGQLNRHETLTSPAGDVRTVSVPVLVDGERAAELQVIAPLAAAHAEADEAALLVGAAAGLALLVGGTLLGITLWGSLAPLGSLASAARATELQSLHARVDEPDADDEVGQLAREFNRMLDRLEEASARQNEFMASVGHELRTPITIVRGHLELLARSDTADTAPAEAIAILQDELGRMSRLVDDLMAISRADMDEFVRPRPVELVAWFEDLELRLAAIDVDHRVTVEPPPPVIVVADPDRLAQAVLNLVVNSRVHTPSDTRIRVHAKVHERTLVVSVADDGPGIPDEIRGRLFEPFVRAGDAPTSTGLGLAVVRAVIEAHAGEIEVVTGVGGTRFDLSLPMPSPDGAVEPIDLVVPLPPREQQSPTVRSSRSTGAADG